MVGLEEPAPHRAKVPSESLLIVVDVRFGTARIPLTPLTFTISVAPFADDIRKERARMRPSSVTFLLLMIGLSWVAPHAQPAAPVQTAINPQSLAELRQWDGTVDQMVRSRELQLRHARPDTLLPGRSHERLAQYHQGLRVFGGEVTRETLAGVTQWVSGISMRWGTSTRRLA